MKRLLVTGSRDWENVAVLREALYAAWRRLNQDDWSVVLVHGAARGADSMAASLWAEQGFPVEPHPAEWETLGRAAGPIRNSEMVGLGADEALAFPMPASIGTYDCIEKVVKAGITVRVYSPDGTYEIRSPTPKEKP